MIELLLVCTPWTPAELHGVDSWIIKTGGEVQLSVLVLVEFANAILIKKKGWKIQNKSSTFGVVLRFSINSPSLKP